jgi:hypothetical protein
MFALIERIIVIATGRPSRRAARRDPWRPLPLEPPLHAFGPGSTREFRDYLEGESTVVVAAIADVVDFVARCRYATDRDLHGEVDAWLHPATLELVRCGDCEDFALWAWRKLVGLGYDARFVVGLRHRGDGTAERHAWVTFHDGGSDYVFDAVERGHERVVRPVTELGGEYEPQVGVDRHGTRYAYAGICLSEWGRRVKLKRRAAFPPSVRGG